MAIKLIQQNREEGGRIPFIEGAKRQAALILEQDNYFLNAFVDSEIFLRDNFNTDILELLKQFEMNKHSIMFQAKQLTDFLPDMNWLAELAEQEKTVLAFLTDSANTVNDFLNSSHFKEMFELLNSTSESKKLAHESFLQIRQWNPQPTNMLNRMVMPYVMNPHCGYPINGYYTGPYRHNDSYTEEFIDGRVEKSINKYLSYCYEKELCPQIRQKKKKRLASPVKNVELKSYPLGNIPIQQLQILLLNMGNNNYLIKFFTPKKEPLDMTFAEANLINRRNYKEPKKAWKTLFTIARAGGKPLKLNKQDVSILNKRLRQILEIDYRPIIPQGNGYYKALFQSKIAST